MVLNRIDQMQGQFEFRNRRRIDHRVETRFRRLRSNAHLLGGATEVGHSWIRMQ
jgi:hypothetical protein